MRGGLVVCVLFVLGNMCLIREDLTVLLGLFKFCFVLFDLNCGTHGQ